MAKTSKEKTQKKARTKKTTNKVNNTATPVIEEVRATTDEEILTSEELNPMSGETEETLLGAKENNEFQDEPSEDESQKIEVKVEPQVQTPQPQKLSRVYSYTWNGLSYN